MKNKPSGNRISASRQRELLEILEERFEKNIARHSGLDWRAVRSKLEAHPGKLWSLNEMETSGGEPDVVGVHGRTSELVFFDCSAQSPKGRRSLCYDDEALASRKEHKPQGSACGVAAAMGIELLSEEQYRQLQTFGPFDTTTSSWVETPSEIRLRGGALFCDRRYEKVFVYHNGAESYYAARGFRGLLRIG